jgi:hypothetical protein
VSNCKAALRTFALQAPAPGARRGVRAPGAWYKHKHLDGGWGWVAARAGAGAGGHWECCGLRFGFGGWSQIGKIWTKAKARSRRTQLLVLVARSRSAFAGALGIQGPGGLFERRWPKRPGLLYATRPRSPRPVAAGNSFIAPCAQHRLTAWPAAPAGYCSSAAAPWFASSSVPSP